MFSIEIYFLLFPFQICFELYNINVTGFLLGAPCPPPSNFSLLCDYISVLTCEEKTVIIRKCLQVLPYVKCDILETCQHLKCLPQISLLRNCYENISNTPITDEIVGVLSVNNTQNITLGHSKMAEATDSTVKYYEELVTEQNVDDLPVHPLREEKDSLVGLAALLLLLIPLVFIIW